MKVLITGASGFLGSSLVDHALANGHQVRAFVRKTSRTESLEARNVEIARGDLKNPESLRAAVAGVDVVINAASSMDAVSQETEAATIKGTRDLLAAAEQAGVRRFVHISSIGIYAVCKLSSRESIDEDYPLEKNPRFLSDYVTSKMSSEAAAIEYGTRGKMSVIILRSGVLYGPQGKWSLPRTGYIFGNVCLVIGSGRNLLPSCYVENCATAAIAAAEHASVTHGIFNIVDDELIGQEEFLRRVRRDAKGDLRIIRIPYTLFYIFAYVGERIGKILKIPFPFRTPHVFMCGWQARYSNQRAKAVLGWRPEIGKEEALVRTTKYLAARTGRTRADELKASAELHVNAAPIRIGMIGCGVIAEEHLKIIKAMRGVEVVGICDPNAEASAKIASQFGIANTYPDVHRMLAAARPDSVHIVTPPQSHFPLTEAALRAGCHVLVEKPMAMNAVEARAMTELAAKSGKKLCVDHNHLFDPIVVQARRLIESGELGDILWVESYYGFDLGNNPDSRYLLPGGENHWTFQLPGGLYQNLASHPLSLALDVLGKPTRVQAHARYGRVLPHAATDELRIFLETPNATGLAVVSLAASPRHQFLKVYGTKMTIHVDVLNKWLVAEGSIKGLPKPISRAIMHLRHGSTIIGGTLSSVSKVLRRKWAYTDGMDSLIRHFYDSIRADRPAPVTAEDGLLTMEIMDKAWEQIGMGPSANSDNRETTLVSEHLRN